MRYAPLVEVASALYPRLLNGQFYDDHDGDLAVVGSLRTALAALEEAGSAQ